VIRAPSLTAPQALGRPTGAAFQLLPPARRRGPGKAWLSGPVTFRTPAGRKPGGQPGAGPIRPRWLWEDSLPGATGWGSLGRTCRAWPSVQASHKRFLCAVLAAVDGGNRNGIAPRILKRDLGAVALPQTTGPLELA